MAFVVGQCIADYEVDDVLGSGGMGCIYRVRNVISGRTEAMKVLQADLRTDAVLAARFRSEIRTLAGFQHPNIAQLHTALQHGNELLMIMEFVEGCTLHQLARQAPLRPLTTVGYIQQVLSALSYAHDRGVIHCDVKPANIMIAPQGVVKLMDFGIARLKARDDAGSPGQTCGSPKYMSPEQALGNVTIDERSDIYSLGITLYKLLTGHLPFDDDPTHLILHRQVNEVPWAPIEINPRLQKSLSDLVMKALEKDPAKRFQTAAEFSYQLGEVTGIAASKAILIAGGFSDVMGSGPAGGVAWVSPTAAHVALSRISTKRFPSQFTVAAVAALLLAVLTPVGIFGWRKGRFVPKQALPVAATRPIGTAITTYAARAPEVAKPVVALQQQAVLKQPSSPPRAAARSQRPVDAISYADEDTPSAQPDAHPLVAAAATAELQQVRRQQDALNALANTIRSQMARLRNQKIIEGHELNQDMADAYVDMNQSLNAGIAELRSGNAAAARSHMEKATYAVNVLEKLFRQDP